MACTDIFSASGMVISIAPAANMPATLDQTGWEAVTGWEEIGEISAIGDYGEEAALVQFKGLDGVICKSKGSVNYGSASITMALVPEDAGQTLLRTAAAGTNKSTFPFKITYADTTATLDNPSIDYFGAVVLSFKKQPGGDADSIVMGMAQMEWNTAITSVDRFETP